MAFVERNTWDRGHTHEILLYIACQYNNRIVAENWGVFVIKAHATTRVISEYLVEFTLVDDASRRNVGFRLQKCISGHLESKRAFQDRTKANITPFRRLTFRCCFCVL